jgi:ABC-2 type transport system permease protein
MSSAPAAQPAGRPAALPGGPDARGAAPLGRLMGLGEALHAEWTKLRTLPGTPWLAAAIVAATVSVSTAAASAVSCPSGSCGVDPTKLSLTGIDLGQAVAAVFAVLVISSEYSSGMIRITMSAVPRRVTVLTAKATIVSGLVLAAGIIAVAGSLLAGHAILPGHGFTPAHGYPPVTLADGRVLRAAAG